MYTIYMMINKKHLLLLLSSSLFLSACTPTQTPSQTPTPTTTPTPTEQTLSTSVRELMAMGSNLQCTYDFTDSQSKVQTKGTTYISGKNFAQESDIILPPTSSAVGGKMNMISDGTTVYTWNPDKKATGGMKFVIDKAAKDQAQANKNNVDLDKKIDMKCSPWNVDQAKFTVPTDVKFTDLSQLMQGIKDTTKNLPANVPTVPKNIPNIPAGY